MTLLAPILESFFSERLQRQRRASPCTIAAYRDAFRLLLGFARTHLGKEPSALLLADIDVSLVGAFLDHLEKERGNSVRTRNARLAAIHSFFRFAAAREPAHASLIQRVLAIPQKRFDRSLVTRRGPRHEGARPGTNRAAGCRGRPLPAQGLAPRLPGGPVIMPRRERAPPTPERVSRCRSA